MERKVGVIVGHGRFLATEAEREALRRAEVVVAADGGAQYAWEAGRRADVAVGDWDSLGEALPVDEADRPDYLQVCRIATAPREKDETDAELALDEAVRQGCTELVFLGALGGRLDHMLANLQLLVAGVERGVRASVLDGECRIWLLKGGAEGLSGQLDRLEVAGRPGEYLSLLPVTPVVAGVWTEGLKYPLRGEDLWLGRTRGISNEFLAEKAAVGLAEGMLLVVAPGAAPGEESCGVRRVTDE